MLHLLYHCRSAKNCCLSHFMSFLTSSRQSLQVLARYTAASSQISSSPSRATRVNFSLPLRSFTAMPPKKDKSGSNGTVAEGSHKYQAGDTTHREEDQWKHREPYRIHEDDEKFPVKWKGSCHCGNVKYQLSREKPLASKYCHCTTCQRLHGVCSRL